MGRSYDDIIIHNEALLDGDFALIEFYACAKRIIGYNLYLKLVGEKEYYKIISGNYQLPEDYYFTIPSDIIKEGYYKFALYVTKKYSRTYCEYIYSLEVKQQLNNREEILKTILDGD